MEVPWNWSPTILELQMVQVGPILILALPFEITTMASRRLRKSILEESTTYRMQFDHIIISPLANDYSDYLTTFEEYSEQRYEGASTVYGPNSLKAVIYHFKKMLPNLRNSKSHESSDESLRPPDNRNHLYSWIPDVLFDIRGPGDKDGIISEDVKSEYKTGETVTAEFYGANPRNDQNVPFMEVQRFDLNSNQWVFHDDDSSWFTKVYWRRYVQNVEKRLC